MSTTQSYLSFSINEIDNRLKEVMINDNEITTLQTYMGSYVKISDLSSYAKVSDLGSYAKTTDLSYYATKTDLTSYAKVSDLGSYAKTSDLTSYAKTSDLTSYAKVSDLGSYAKTSDLTSYATISYVNSSILTSYNLYGISLSHVDSVYTLMQGTNKIGDINVPKDLVIQSGEIVKDPEGMAAGTYIKLTLNATEATPIYINVQDLVNVYHAKMLSEGDTDGVQVTISETNEISARISGNINADKVELYDTTTQTYLFLNAGFNANKSAITNVNGYVATLGSYVNTHVVTLQTYVDNLQVETGYLQTYVGTLQVETGYLQTYVDTLQVETGYLQTYVGTLQTYVGTLQTYVDTAKSNITTLNADVNTVGSVDYKVHASAYTTSYDFNVLLSALTYRVTYLESLVIK